MNLLFLLFYINTSSNKITKKKKIKYEIILYFYRTGFGFACISF